MKAVCFDFDDVVIRSNPFLKAKIHGHRLEEIKIASEFFSDNLHPEKFYKVMQKMIKLVEGIEIEEIRKIVLSAKPTKNVGFVFRTLKKKGYKIFIISINDAGLIKEFLRKNRLKVDGVYASKIGVTNGRLNGKISGSVIRTEKIGILRELKRKYNISRKDVIYIGDGLTDIPVMRKSGKSILFCPSELIKLEFFGNKCNGPNSYLAESGDMKEVLDFIS